MLELGACAFSFLGVSRGSFHFAHVTIVAEVDNDDDRNGDEKRPEASGAKTAHNKTSARGTSEVADRHPEKVAAPHVPDRLIRFECSGSRSETGVDQVLHEAHETKRDDCCRSALLQKTCRRAEGKLENVGRCKHCTRQRGAAKGDCSHLAA